MAGEPVPEMITANIEQPPPSRGFADHLGRIRHIAKADRKARIGEHGAQPTTCAFARPDTRLAEFLCASDRRLERSTRAADLPQQPDHLPGHRASRSGQQQLGKASHGIQRRAQVVCQKACQLAGRWRTKPMFRKVDQRAHNQRSCCKRASLADGSTQSRRTLRARQLPRGPARCTFSVANRDLATPLFGRGK